MHLHNVKTLKIKENFPTRRFQEVRVRVLPDGRMTRRDAALYLGLSPKTLAIWASQGRGPRRIRVGGRVFYFRDDLDAFVRRDGADSR